MTKIYPQLPEESQQYIRTKHITVTSNSDIK